MRTTPIFAAVLLAILGGAAIADVAVTPGKPSGRLAVGEAAPEISAMSLDGTPASLALLRSGGAEGGTARPLVLQFGSITDPIFRAHAPAVERLAAKYGDRAAFVVVYQREAHPADGDDALELNKDGFSFAEPAGMEERQKLAKQAADRLHLEKQTVVVDTWNNATSARYGSYPNMTFVMDGRGILQAGYPFMDPTKVGRALDAILAGRELPPELRGSVKRGPAASGWSGAEGSAPGAFDFAGAAMDMTGGRGPAGIAAALDHVRMTDGQRAIILPAVADFMADLQGFRQTAAQLPARGGRAGAPARGPARGAAPAAAAGAAKDAAANGEEKKPVTAQDVQAAQATLRASADRLKTVIRQNLNAKDAATLLQALDNIAPAQRLFGM